MMEAHLEGQIRDRFNLIVSNTRGINSKAVSRIAREYGVNPTTYYLGMSSDQIISATLKNQTVPSQLELEMLNEARQYSF